MFIDLRDRSAVLQIVVDPKSIPAAIRVGLQDCIRAHGTLRERPEGQRNNKMITGDVELEVDELEILNRSKVPPFVVESEVKASEELRLRYRYLDLRREPLRKAMIFRHRVVSAMREYLNAKEFIEIETPILTRSMPEGARDYLVPSRIYPKKFYALAQSPQMYKQLLMVAGFERYYQVARCLRDENPRHDRQPEHTQIDIEMSFISEDDVFKLIEGMFVHILKSVLDQNIKTPFPRFTYAQAMEKYGSDKPDLRLGMELRSYIDVFKEKDFVPFKAEYVSGIIIPGAYNVSRKYLDELNEKAKKAGLAGVYWTRKDEKYSGSIAKLIDESIAKQLNLRAKEILLLVSGNTKALAFLGEVRKDLGRSQIKDDKGFNFLWVQDFPLFEIDETSGKLIPCHHIFTMPKQEDMQYLETEPLKIRGRQYDLVCNGNELASGSIRNHIRLIQEKLFEYAGMDPGKYTMLLDALDFGAPPHGGIAPGIDRIVMILAGLQSLRDVIAFPKTTTAQGLLEGIPDEVSPEQLKELGIKFEGLI